MMAKVRDAYDSIAELYAQLFLGDLDGDTYELGRLAAFAELAATRQGMVADLGCGPGHVVNHLSELGLTAVGYDISPGQVAEARKAFPDLQFRVGDLAALDIADGSLGGIVARYSLIHMLPSRLADVFAEWMRVLEPGAPVLVSFFGSTSAEAHGTPFDHTVVTAYELFPATIAEQLQGAGFADVEIGIRPPPGGGRPFDQATVLAHRTRSATATSRAVSAVTSDARSDELRSRLHELRDAAQRRVDEGLYGTCTTCAAEISAERLAVLPATATCVNCAR